MSEGRKRPYKVWDHRRYAKKALVAGSLTELIARGREKLRYEAVGSVSAVLETDGTAVDDAEYFATLPDNTVFLLLREQDRWVPPGVDVLRAALTCIPRIVCQTMQALDLRDEAPSWKIADNRGQVTVQLHWDSSRGVPGTERRPHLVVRGIGEMPSEPPDAPPPVPPHGAPPPYPARLSRQGSSVESATAPHVHTAECGAPAHHHHHHHHAARGSPAEKTCDFHCCALHRAGVGGGPASAAAITKSAATSPIQEVAGARRQPGHVRFDGTLREAPAAAPAPPEAKGGPSTSAAAGGAVGGSDSSESEEGEDNTANEEGTSTKLLLLVDQLSVERTRYLSIKDIGVILERLSSKILDVERMERQLDGDDCRTWTLKATIRGDVLREIGVVYHGHYHSISEHPRYARRSQPPPPPPAPPAAEPPASQ
ncbi:Cell death activator CIDE-A [Amphibalanus amphitrite]|uniref:Cell death activator CIDE-A n=1 Tax=Amphibalanus amphitrite TaxID=1232801 RepID=A0A6A4VX74_AMPAM|nr:Cell death activator CIDE-A [Amphibalanus amphitrite]